MKKQIQVVWFLGVIVWNACSAASFLSQASEASKLEVVSDAARKFGNLEKQVAGLKNHISQIERESEQERSFLRRFGADLQQAKEQLESADGARARLFFQKRVAAIGDIYQSVNEGLQVLGQMLRELQEHKALLEQLLADPVFTVLSKEDRSAPDFEDLRRVSRMAGDLRDQKTFLQRSLRLLAVDLEKRRRTVDDANKEIQEQEEKQRLFLKSEGVLDAIKDFSRSEQGELIDLQLQNAQQAKKLAQFRLHEIEEKKDYLDLQLVVAKQKLDVVEKTYEKIKRKVRIDVNAVRAAEAKLTQDRQDSLAQQAALNEKKRLILPAIESVKENIAVFSPELNGLVGDLSTVQSWNIDIKKLKTAASWDLALKGLGQYAKLELLESRRSLVEAQIDSARYAYLEKERTVAILDTWRWLTREYRVNLGSYIDEAVKSYESIKIQLSMEESDIQAQRDAAIKKLYQLNLMREDVKRFSLEVREDSIEKSIPISSVSRQKMVKTLVGVDDDLRAALNEATKLVEALSKNLAFIQSQKKNIEDILTELSARSFWMRSDQSISMQDLKDFFPDLGRFFSLVWTTLKAYSSHASLQYFFERAGNYLNDFSSIVTLFFWFLFVALAFFVLRWGLPLLRRLCMRVSGRGMRFMSFLAFLLHFLQAHFFLVYGWSVVFVFVSYVWSGQGPQALFFFLLSIPILLYVAVRFFAIFAQTNREHGFVWVSAIYSHRFFAGIPSLFFGTIVFSFLRWAFIASNSAFDSQVPEILLAVNIIFLQLVLISLISKDVFIGQNTVLWFIPRSSSIGSFLEEKIERYYFVFQAFLAVIIVLNNPYVGYGKQMFYVLVRVFGTLIIVPLVVWFYDWFKKVSSELFFHYPDGIVAKERFSSGKMWYGFFVLGSFIAFIFLGFFIVSLIWGHTVTYTELIHFFQKELFPVGNDALTGKPIQITVYSLVKVFLYVFGGILVVYVLNSFILSRIFDPMLVGSGVQNTIMTFSRYMIFVVAFFMGLQSVGLDSLATKLGLIIAGVAYIFKEPIGDFLSYFIILVQRPVKVGDFIRMEDPYKLEGFVRFITPRSTIIRTRNSNVYIIPNTLIITRPVQNWHYSKTFASTEDIMFVVSYDIDPYFVQTLLREVLAAHPALLKNPEPVARLFDFVSNGQQFLIRGYITAERVVDKWEIESDLRLAVVKKLGEHNITVSVPIQIRTKS